MTELLPPSPCLGICIMDPRTRQCRGCLRTVEEIAAWYEASPGGEASADRGAQRAPRGDGGEAQCLG